MNKKRLDRSLFKEFLIALSIVLFYDYGVDIKVLEEGFKVI